MFHVSLTEQRTDAEIWEALKDTKFNKVTYFKTIVRVAFHAQTGAAGAQVTPLEPHQVLKNSN